MIKRIGILTFHASHNYGSMLQAYAMQTYLKKRGIEAENINLRTNIQKKHVCLSMESYQHTFNYKISFLSQMDDRKYKKVESI